MSLELLILEDYLDILDSQLPGLIQRERDKIWEKVDLENQYAADGAAFRQHYLDEGISIRFLTAAALIGIWAEYEACVTKLSEYLRSARGLSLELKHLKGGFLEAAKRYYEGVLRFPLHGPDTDWGRLDAIATVRHALAHANGRMVDVERYKRKKIEALISDGASLIVRDEYLIVTRKYARDAFTFINALLTDLASRVEHEIQSTH
jgi:hypothetical protein